MLGCDRQHGSTREPGTDPGILDGSEEVRFEGRNREEVYGWVNQTLRQQRYEELKRSGRGLVRRYLAKMTGLSRAQITRLVTMYREGEAVQPKPYRRRRFAQRYTREDIELLAEVGDAHEVLSGPATQKILQRAHYDFKEPQYQRLAELSVPRHCTGCDRGARTGNSGWRIKRRGRRRWRSANGVGRNQTGGRGICGSIRFWPRQDGMGLLIK